MHKYWDVPSLYAEAGKTWRSDKVQFRHKGQQIDIIKELKNIFDN